VVRTTKGVQILRERAPHCYIIRYVLLSVKMEVVILKKSTAVSQIRILASCLRPGNRKAGRGEALCTHREAVSVRFRNVRLEALNVH
jgi:hypothetical protein